MSFIEEIKERARRKDCTIVLPESYEKRTIEATSKILAQGFAKIVLLKEPGKEIDRYGFDISKAQIVEMQGELLDKFAGQFYELRKNKGMTPEKAAQTVKNPLYFATMMMKNQMVDGMVAGAINSTGNTLRPALQIIKAKKGIKTVSSFLILDVPNCELGHHGLFLVSDPGLVEFPTAEQLYDIAVASAHSFEDLTGAEPRVALLSYSTYGSAKNEKLQKIIDAAARLKADFPNLRVDGELQADAALIGEVGRLKAPGSNVAGCANVLIFPDLNTGNICYKLVQRLAKAEAYGPITQGLNMPINDLSRGCVPDDIVGVVALTCMQVNK